MDPKKLEFFDDVVHIVRDIAKLLFNLKSDNDLENVLRITNPQLEEVIKKIIDKLPEKIFNQSGQKLEEIKNIFAREFIFFQVQEKWNDPQYQNDLSKFTHIFSRDIQQRIKERSNQL